jgi:hypothetical protein
MIDVDTYCYWIQSRAREYEQNAHVGNQSFKECGEHIQRIWSPTAFLYFMREVFVRTDRKVKKGEDAKGFADVTVRTQKTEQQLEKDIREAVDFYRGRKGVQRTTIWSDAGND